jgi:hypothetical protein
MAVMLIETESPEKVRVTSAAGKPVHVNVQSTRYRAALKLLAGCSLEQLRTLELEHLRQIKQQLAGVEHLPLAPAAKPIDAVGA